MMTSRLRASATSCTALAVAALWVVGLFFADQLPSAPDLLSSNDRPEVLPRLPSDQVALQPARTRSTVSLPAAFVENRGQWDLPAQYVLQRGATTTFAEAGAVVLMKETQRDASSRQGAVVRLEFEGSNRNARLLGKQRLTGERHYFFGNDPDRWQRFVPGYTQVLYEGLYAGVDLVLREQGEQLEYDLLLEPWAELESVVVRCDGIESLSLEPDGALLLETAAGPLRQPAPKTWWVTEAGEQQPVTCAYRLLGDRRYGFVVEGPHFELPLVIDPGLEWSTHFGGSFLDYVEDVVLGPSGAVTFTGDSRSVDLPVTAGAFDISFNPGGGSLARDVYVCQLTPAGDGLVFCTYLGAEFPDWSCAIAQTPDGDIVIGGDTVSQGFPVTAGAFDTVMNFPFSTPFVTRLSADGSELVFSTFLGGTGFGLEQVFEVIVEPSGSILVMGRAETADFPTTPGAYDTTPNGARDVFISRLDSSGSTLLASTLLGGTNTDRGLGMCLTDSGDVVVVVSAASLDYPTTPGAFISPWPGFFVTCLKADLSDLVFSASVGGSLPEVPRAVTIDPLGNIVFAGETFSKNYPVTPDAFKPIPGGSAFDDESFLSVLDPTGSTLVYSTYIGGGGTDDILALAVDSSGAMYFAGNTGAANYPTTKGAFDTDFDSALFGELFVSKLSPDGQTLHYSTYLGGSNDDGSSSDSAISLALDPSGSIVLATGSRSADYPTTPGAFEPNLQGPVDAVITRLDLLPTGVTRYGSSTAGCAGPLGISVTAIPDLGSKTFAINCTSAPASSTRGWLLISGQSLATPMPAAGIELWIDFAALVVALPVSTNTVGYCEQPLRIPNDPSLLGIQGYAQFVWRDACQPAGWSASPALDITVQQ